MDLIHFITYFSSLLLLFTPGSVCRVPSSLACTRTQASLRPSHPVPVRLRPVPDSAPHPGSSGSWATAPSFPLSTRKPSRVHVGCANVSGALPPCPPQKVCTVVPPLPESLAGAAHRASRRPGCPLSPGLPRSTPGPPLPRCTMTLTFPG